MLRAAAASIVFVFATAGSLALLTGMALALLWSLAGFRWDALAFAIVIYAPMLGMFLVVSTAVGLWLSHRIYNRWGRPRTDRLPAALSTRRARRL